MRKIVWKKEYIFVELFFFFGVADEFMNGKILLRYKDTKNKFRTDVDHLFHTMIEK